MLPKGTVMFVWKLDLQLPMQSTYITIIGLSSNFTQDYVMKFISDLRQVGGFSPLLRFPPPIKLIATI